VAWLTAGGLAGASLGGLRPVKVPPRPATVAHGVLVGWSAARVQRRGRPWRSARELTLDTEPWAVQVRGDRGASRYRLPDLAVWLHASKPPVALVADCGLARADRQRVILEGWRHAIHSGRYLGVRYGCTSESVADRVAYLAEKVHLAEPQFLATVQPKRDEILELASRDPEESALQTAGAEADTREAAQPVQLTLLTTPAQAPNELRNYAPAPELETQELPEPEPPVADEERERVYQELLGIQEPKRRWRRARQ
jgi:hypothetical protein